MKRFIALLLALSMAFAMLATVSADSEKTYVLKAAASLAADHPYSLALNFMSEQLKERSNGRIQLDVYPGGQLGGESAYVEMMQMGTLDCAVLATAPLANFIDTMAVFDLPYLFNNTEHVYAVEDSEIGDAMLEELSTIGIKGLEFMECGFMALGCNKPLTCKEDIKGVNVRIMENVIYQDFFTALGANPITMSMTELVTALQNGTVDCYTNPVVTAYANKLHPSAPYTSKVDCIYIPAILLFSQDVFDSLPADLQALIVEVSEEAKQYERGLFVDLIGQSEEAMVADGASFIDIDPSSWKDQAIVDSIYAKYVGSLIPADRVEAILAMA